VEEVDEKEEKLSCEEEVEYQPAMGEEFPHISIHTIDRINTYQTIRVTGKVKKRRPLHILIDSGSTHNFLDLTTAKRLNCNVRNIVSL